jgi:hypothetical protein
VEWRELRKEWFRRRARMVLQSRHGLSRWERTAGAGWRVPGNRV